MDNLTDTSVQCCQRLCYASFLLFLHKGRLPARGRPQHASKERRAQLRCEAHIETCFIHSEHIFSASSSSSHAPFALDLRKQRVSRMLWLTSCRQTAEFWKPKEANDDYRWSTRVPQPTFCKSDGGEADTRWKSSLRRCMPERFEVVKQLAIATDDLPPPRKIHTAHTTTSHKFGFTTCNNTTARVSTPLPTTQTHICVCFVIPEPFRDPTVHPHFTLQ